MKTVESGVDKPNALEPLDVRASVMLEWLMERSLIQRERLPLNQQPQASGQQLQGHQQLRKALAAVRKLAVDAVTAAKSSNATVVLESLQKYSETYPKSQNQHATGISYPQCMEVFETLLKSEPTSKTLFGKYTSPLLQQWHELISAYHAKNLHLLELADELVSITKYDIPVIKQDIFKAVKEAEESSKQATESLKSAAQYRTNFQNQCTQLKIAGKDVRTEIRGLASELTDIFNQFVSQLKGEDKYISLESAIDLYEKFSSITALHNPSVLPLLEHLMKYGNETVASMKSRKEPQIELQPKPMEVDTSAGANITIDWSALQQATSPAIEFDPSTIEIPEDDLLAAETSGFEIELLDGSQEKLQDIASIPTITSEKPSAQETILLNSNMRKQVIHELLELQCFLLQRLNEIDTQQPYDVMLAVVPNSLKENPKGKHVKRTLSYETDIRKFLEAVKALLGILQSQRAGWLLEVRESDRFVERIAVQLDSLNDCAARLEATAAELHVKAEELRITATEQQKQQKAALERARYVGSVASKEISKLLGNREITVIV